MKVYVATKTPDRNLRYADGSMTGLKKRLKETGGADTSWEVAVYLLKTDKASICSLIEIGIDNYKPDEDPQHFHVTTKGQVRAA
jgi:hypothetical protein